LKKKPDSPTSPSHTPEKKVERANRALVLEGARLRQRLRILHLTQKPSESKSPEP
jgi:hypothetical protein